jgi:hypothetical protein
MAQLDENKLHQFVGKMLGDLGGAFSVPTVRIGLRLGLFNALHEGGPATADELAKRAGGLTERYVREWALAQAANGFVDYNTTSRKFSLSPEQAMVFAEKDSPVYLAGGREYPSEMNCTLALSADNEDELLEAAVQQAITVHGHEDTPDLRTMIRTAMRDGTPPVEAPRRAA